MFARVTFMMITSHHLSHYQCSVTQHITHITTRMRCNIWRKIKKFKLRKLKLKKGSNVNVKIIKFRKTIFLSVPDLLRLQRIKEQHDENKERISDYMEMTVRKRRIPDCAAQEYEIMSYVDFRGQKSEIHEAGDGTSEDESIYEEYDG